MKIAILSDSHDHLENLEKVLERVREEGAEAVLHCGDFGAPFILHELDALGVPVHGVFGNVDGDRHLMTPSSHTPGSPALPGRFILAGDGDRS